MTVPLRPAVVELRGVHKSFGTVHAVERIDLRIGRGEVVALLGPNGAGKTTTMHLMLGLLRPDRGSVSLMGLDPVDPRARTHVGAMLQHTNLPIGLRVDELLELFSSYYPAPLPVAESLRLAQLEKLCTRRFGALSAGERQRLRFALSLCGDPELLLLDEPTANLDAVARRNVWDHLRARADRGHSILFATHDLDEADALADRVVLLREGEVLRDDTPRAIKASIATQHASCETALPETDFHGIPGVTLVHRVGTRVELRAGAGVPIARELYRRDPNLQELTIKQASLEEAFQHLTGPEGA